MDSKVLNPNNNKLSAANIKKLEAFAKADGRNSAFGIKVPLTKTKEAVCDITTTDKGRVKTKFISVKHVSTLSE